MDKVPMTVADVYPATRPGRTGVGSVRHPPDPHGDRTEDKAGRLGEERQFPISALSLGGDLVCKLRRSTPGVTVQERRLLGARGRGRPAGEGCPGNPGRASPSSAPSSSSSPSRRPTLRTAAARLLPRRLEAKGPGRRTVGGEEEGRQVKAYRLLLLDPRHAGWQLRRPARWNSEPGSREQTR